jgi:MFS family permease
VIAARKITWTLFVAQALSSTAFLAAAAINSIVGADLSGRPEWAGVPGAFYQFGVAAASLILGYAMDWIGRRGALAWGFTIGALGAAIAGWSAFTGTFAGFLLGLTLMGPANAAATLSRFAAAEVHPPHARGRAIANVVIGGTAGTVIWPAMSFVLTPALSSSRVNELVWPYFVSLTLLVASSLVIFIFLRPDPRDIARTLAGADRITKGGPAVTGAAPLWNILARPGAAVAISSMVLAQGVMVMVMVITSLHMRNHHHSVTAISLTISAHVIGMFAFSILSGRLADRIGRAPVIMTGAIVLAMACVAAPFSPAFVPITGALFLLGLGWNFCFVGGSSLLADQLSPDERARTQGFNDLLMGLVAASGSFLSGHIFAALGYGTMGLVSAALAVAPLVVAGWWHFAAPAAARTVVRPTETDAYLSRSTPVSIRVEPDSE